MSYPSMSRFLAIVGALSMATMAIAQEPTLLSPGKQFTVQAGAQIYQNSCQGCHMANGKGAQGAGAYPALANNKNLAVPEYLVFVILNGKSGMPGFREYMSDEQIANVANHVRSSFGNSHGPEVTAGFVKNLSSR